MRILIADDEAPARGELSYLLEEVLPSTKIAQACDGEEAIERVQAEDFDLVFLDIQMPGKDGLEVATKILESPRTPHIVFATAYSEHAVEAFRLSALDYLVKPISRERLEQTISRLKAGPELRAGVQKLLKSQDTHKLWVEASEDRWVLISYEDIQYIKAQDKKVYVCVDGYPPLRIRRTLKELEEEMRDRGFLRVHKAYLVNLKRVKEMTAWFSGSYTLFLNTEQTVQVPLSRRFVSKFREATDW